MNCVGSRVLSKYCSRVAASLLQRSMPPSSRVQSRCYAKSSRCSHEKQITNLEAPRSRRNYIVPAALLGGFAGVALIFHFNDERRAVLIGQKNSDPCNCNETNPRLGPVIGGPFKLVNTDLHVVTEKNLLGNWVLLHFGYTSSPDVGPEQLGVMAKATDVLESKQNAKVLPVFVTIDPQRDTPSQLRSYLKEFDPQIMGLTGPVAAIRQMAQEYRVYFRKVEEDGDDYLVESSHNMYLLNPKMEVVRCYGTEYNAEELSEAILKEIRRDSE